VKQYLTIAILLELAKKEKVTAKYLANKFEISTRSVYRYLNELESAGIPTFTIVGKNGGIGIEKNFALNSLLLTEEEKIILRKSLALIYNEKVKTIIQKLNL
jgi:predicted DNA-binding transcriptional regulator YafY